jgi:uncharacterized protein YfbU (UPF0304 family)
MNAKTERFEMRLDQATIDKVEAWRSEQADLPSRAESIRRLVERSLANTSPGEVSITDGERLIMLMLCELYKGLKIKGEIEPEFIQDVICGGHFWALEWEYTGIFHKHKDSRKTLSEVVDILDMWSFIEEAYNKLSPKEKKAVQAATNRQEIRFVGFDGNNESEHMGIARFLIEKMGRFQTFKGRSLNAHCPSIAGHRAMLSVFLPIRPTLIGHGLSSKQIIEIMKVRG